jgi:hypothetical protein
MKSTDDQLPPCFGSMKGIDSQCSECPYAKACVIKCLEDNKALWE